MRAGHTCVMSARSDRRSPPIERTIPGIKRPMPENRDGQNDGNIGTLAPNTRSERRAVCSGRPDPTPERARDHGRSRERKRTFRERNGALTQARAKCTATATHFRARASDGHIRAVYRHKTDTRAHAGTEMLRKRHRSRKPWSAEQPKHRDARPNRGRRNRVRGARFRDVDRRRRLVRPVRDGRNGPNPSRTAIRTKTEGKPLAYAHDHACARANRASEPFDGPKRNIRPFYRPISGSNGPKPTNGTTHHPKHRHMPPKPRPNTGRSGRFP